MQIIASEQVVYVDVDNTLIYPTAMAEMFIECPYDNSKLRYRKMHQNIKILKDRKARGATIIVHSANGYKWAETVVKALELEPYVDFVLSKSIAYIDDLDCVEWMGPRIYIAE